MQKNHQEDRDAGARPEDDNPAGTNPGGWRSGGGTRPAHWQNTPLPRERMQQTGSPQIDERAAGRGRQYGAAGAYGRAHEQQMRRPPRGYTRSDDSLLDEVCDMLSRSRIDVSDVTVSVQDGVVTLTGTVARRNDRRETEYHVANCPGTVDVVNRLKVVDSPLADPSTPRLGGQSI